MKRFLLLLFFPIFSGMLWGCGAEREKPVSHIVTGVDIFCQHEDGQIRRHYTDQEKMHYALLYLRLAKPMGKADRDPQALGDDVYEITVRLADGREKVYRQTAHRYFCEGDRPWHRIDPEHAANLYLLMRKIPGDSLSQKTPDAKKHRA